MLKVLYKKLRLSSKGNLNYNNYSNLSKLQIRKVRKLHTIGRYTVQGIPVLSIFALVGIIVRTVILQPIEETSITPQCLAWEEQCDEEPVGGCPEGYAWLSDGSQICPYACRLVEASASLTIGGAGETEQVPAGRGATTYRNHTVRVQASNVSNYGLVITGPSNLTPPSDGTVITGISNKTGTEMDSSNEYDNTWGYGWGDTNTSDSNLTYRTLSPTGTNILTVNGTNDKPVLVNRAVDFTKKLVFAVKFSEDATPGRYYANVTLSLTATPSTLTTYSITYNGNGNTGGTVPAKQEANVYDTASYNGFTAAANTGNLTKTGYNFLGWAESSSATAAQYAVGDTIPLTQSKPEITLYAVWEKEGPNVTGFGGIKKMQDMTPAVCKSVNVGTSGQLYDTRDDSVYPVVKAADQKCWMTQNLAFDINQATGDKAMSSNNSDVNAGWSWPTLPSYFMNPAVSTTLPGDGMGYRSDFGYYYPWGVATAGGQANSSICPKGWKLPSGGASGDFAGLAKLYSDNQSATYKRILLGASSPAAGGVYFLAAGFVNSSNTLVYPGANGLYWSRTANSSSTGYLLGFFNGYLNADSHHDAKSNALTIRCVAYSS